MSILSFLIVLQTLWPFSAAVPDQSNALRRPDYVPPNSTTSLTPSDPHRISSDNGSSADKISATSNLTSYSTLVPSWNHNVLREFHKLLGEYKFRNANPQEIFAKSFPAVESANVDDFKELYMYIQYGPTERLDCTGVPTAWGLWTQRESLAPPFAHRPPFEIHDIKVTIGDAFRVAAIAGYPGPWTCVTIRKIPGPDPYFAPGQPYYVLQAGIRRALVAVGATNRIFVKNFPRSKRDSRLSSEINRPGNGSSTTEDEGS